jgi:hypothetical protein
MIIVEGPDNTGKTTLIKQLCYRIPQLKYDGHSGGPPKTVEEWNERMYRVLLKPVNETIPYIIDRFFFSELVYGKVLRGKTMIPLENMDVLAERLFEHNPLIIYCRRPIQRIKDDFNVREQLSGVYENLTKICWEYDKLFSLGWPFVGIHVYNFEDKDALKIVVERVKEYLQRWEVLTYEY